MNSGTIHRQERAHTNNAATMLSGLMAFGVNTGSGMIGMSGRPNFGYREKMAIDAPRKTVLNLSGKSHSGNSFWDMLGIENESSTFWNSLK